MKGKINTSVDRGCSKLRGFAGKKLRVSTMRENAKQESRKDERIGSRRVKITFSRALHRIDSIFDLPNKIERYINFHRDEPTRTSQFDGLCESLLILVLRRNRRGDKKKKEKKKTKKGRERPAEANGVAEAKLHLATSADLTATAQRDLAARALSPGIFQRHLNSK
ncbi:hypothetical protein PUN28_017104 [Cardiocondyla obscurior]|uniref:Uncharacterized protein n=1 Tax=Cardiocondyla obscurior TaxID=286306 RepID=A0AAW2EKB5_9HYME